MAAALPEIVTSFAYGRFPRRGARDITFSPAFFPFAGANMAFRMSALRDAPSMERSGLGGKIVTGSEKEL